jgi:hypothetical protein
MNRLNEVAATTVAPVLESEGGVLPLSYSGERQDPSMFQRQRLALALVK